MAMATASNWVKVSIISFHCSFLEFFLSTSSVTDRSFKIMDIVCVFFIYEVFLG